MIITQSPLRITFGGGGTDLPSYYRNHGGFLISAAIDKYVYVTVMKPFTPGIFLKYSQLENVKRVDDVKHPIIREALKIFHFERPQIEITTLADIPAGTGLGSSGSFSTALLKSLYTFCRQPISPTELAELACDIEINRLKEPVGKQDQYIASIGGITCFNFNSDDTVEAKPLRIGLDTLYDLEDNLLLFFTGFSREAKSVLKDQDARTQESDPEMLNNLHYIKELGLKSQEALESGDTHLFGELMHEHWEHKRRRSSGMSNKEMDSWYELGHSHGAVGGKLVGAGGGGFLMFYVEDRKSVRQAMTKAGLQEIRFKFDIEGTKVVLVG